MDMCHRLLGEWPDRVIVFEPSAVVWHYVHPDRLTWRYFWRRCYFVNLGKVEAFANMQDAAHLGAELAFVGRIMTRNVPAEVHQALRGDMYGLARAGAMVVGIVLAGLGHLSGELQLRWSRRRSGVSSMTSSSSMQQAQYVQERTGTR